MAGLYVMMGGSRTVSSTRVLTLRPSGELPEVASEFVLAVGSERTLTVGAYVDLIRKATQDERIEQIVLRPGPLGTAPRARVEELRAALQQFRAAGKHITAYLEQGGLQAYYLATVADRIILMPTASLDVAGLASYDVFLRGTLDLVGAEPDFVHVGKYKTAVNTYTEKTWTPPHREMSESLLTAQFNELVGAIAEGRRKTPDEVRALIDQGPFLPNDALRVGLVDALAYDDQLDDLDDPVPARTTSAVEYRDVSWASLGKAPRARVAVIHASGVITEGESRNDPVNGSVLGAESFIEDLRAARDSGVKAIVVRIDSPGGSAQAADMMWRELSISRSEKLPIIVSMGDLAASGGYYMAVAGDAIVAQPSTLTGSIGVYSGKFAIAGTLGKLGVHQESLSLGRFAEMTSGLRTFTPEEREKMTESVQAIYDTFIERVAEGRRKTAEDVDQLAQGRVWTGRQALEYGLVDALGGLTDAVAIAKAKAGVREEEEVELVMYPKSRGFYDLLSGQLGALGETRSTAAEALLSVLSPREREVLAAVLVPSRLFRPGEPLAHLPYVREP
jgi:protease-4